MKNFILFAAFSLFIFTTHASEQRKALFEGATQRLKDSGIEERVLKKGETFPNIVLNGKALSEFTKKTPVIFTVYRGGWCPFCVKQLKELNEFHKSSKEKSLEIIAISPEVEIELQKTRDKNNLDIELVSDINHEILRGLNLVFKVEDKVAEEYKKIGLDLEKSQGNKNNELPLPATFVIGQNNRIYFVFADADYAKRAELKDLKSALKKASKDY